MLGMVWMQQGRNSLCVVGDFGFGHNLIEVDRQELLNVCVMLDQSLLEMSDLGL
jgi:hypothetical protein